MSKESIQIKKLNNAKAYFLLERPTDSDAQSVCTVKCEGSCLLAENMEPFVVILSEFERSSRYRFEGSLFLTGFGCLATIAVSLQNSQFYNYI